MKRFIITSHGWSASNWLAFALNSHEDIVCTHSARNILANRQDMNSDRSLRENLLQLHQGYVSRQLESLEEKYAKIESLGRGSVYGSVHVLRLRDLPYLWERFGAPNQGYEVMNLVRHPVSLVWSGYGQFRTLFRYDINELHWTLGKVLREDKEYVLETALKYDFYPGDLENLAFIGASVVLGSLRMDLDAEEEVPALQGVNYKKVVRMERVTTDPGELDRVVREISDSQCRASRSYLENVYKAGIVNEHKKDRNKTDAARRYMMFSPWQKEVFNHFFEKYNLRRAYEAYGYDFSFL